MGSPNEIRLRAIYSQISSSSSNEDHPCIVMKKMHQLLKISQITENMMDDPKHCVHEGFDYSRAVSLLLHLTW